jgi:hypothetical protein
MPPRKYEVEEKSDKNLTPKEREQLEAAIREFWGWLNANMDPDVVRPFKEIKFPKPSKDDWIMWVDEMSPPNVFFNGYLRSKCSFGFFESIVIHECFHLFVQNMPNKDDAKHLKHGFGEAVLKMIDIEADFYTALNLKQNRDASLVDVFALYAEGSQVFGDAKIREDKLERFVGTVLSVAKLFFAFPRNHGVIDYDIYIPTLSHVLTEDKVYTVVARHSHFVLEELQVSQQDIKELSKCYTNDGSFTTKGYVETLIKFASKALSTPIPKQIEKQIKALH